MTTKHVDDFLPMPARLHGELDERIALAEKALQYGVAFLDDALRAILPHDLVLIGAPTGLGKTDLALSIAEADARRGGRPHYFALEAEPRELERRLKYKILAREVHRTQLPQRNELNYTDWFLGRCEHIVGGLNAWADRKILEELGRLHTFYRGKEFNAADLARWIIRVHEHATLIVVDHLHYVDAGVDEDENRALGDTVKIIRDVSLRIGRPIILVAHLRKKDARVKKVMPETDDFHGSSNITKIATQVISVERAHDNGVVDMPFPWSATYMAVTKDRRSGARREIALLAFNVLTKSYDDGYTLGRTYGAKWDPIAADKAPSWARNHRGLDGQPATKPPEPAKPRQTAMPYGEAPHAADEMERRYR